MSNEALLESLRTLGWSLFTELGVPGVVRHHQQVVLDPEPIIVAAPSLFELDPRLRDQAYGWCATHASRISVTRLQGLARALPEHARVAFQGLASTLRTHEKVSWPGGAQPPWVRAPEIKTRGLPLERPALLRFRVRGLCGVGARADVVSELIARPNDWTRSSDLADEGYSKRAIAGILADLAQAGIAKQVAEGNALAFRLAAPDQLRELVAARDIAYPSWRHIMAMVLLFLDLAKLQDSSEAVRRVEANKRREALRILTDRMWMDAPPVTRGNPEAWEVLMTWATEVTQALASGRSSVLGVTRVQAELVADGR